LVYLTTFSELYALHGVEWENKCESWTAKDVEWTVPNFKVLTATDIVEGKL